MESSLNNSKHLELCWFFCPDVNVHFHNSEHLNMWVPICEIQTALKKLVKTNISSEHWWLEDVFSIIFLLKWSQTQGILLPMIAGSFGLSQAGQPGQITGDYIFRISKVWTFTSWLFGWVRTNKQTTGTWEHRQRRSQALVNFIQSLPSGRVLLVGVRDEAQRSLAQRSALWGNGRWRDHK